MLLSLLGAPAIHEDGTSRALEFERRTQLLVYVAMKRTWVGRSEVASLLWPDLDAKLAYTNVRKALHRLHSLFGGAVEVQGSALRCLAETDVQAFERALCDGCIADALAAWRGDLLQGFDDDANEAWTGWLRFERERLHSAWRNAAQRRLDDDIDSAEAIDLAARLIEADPLDEDAVRHGLRWLTRAGQHSRARELYREFAARLEREWGCRRAPVSLPFYSRSARAPATQRPESPPNTRRSKTGSSGGSWSCGTSRDFSLRTTAGWCA